MSKKSKRERRLLEQQNIFAETQKPLEIITNPALTIKYIIQKNYLFILLLIIICVGIYFNTIKDEITLVDDMQAFVMDERIKTLASAFKTVHLQKITYGIFYHFFGESPLPLRITSISLHSIDTVLVFVLFYLLFGKKSAMISSLIFAVHPLNTEAVSWISGSPYLYMAMFTFLTLIAFVKFKQTNRKFFLYFSLVVFILEMVLMQSPFILVTFMAMIVVDQMFVENKINFSKLWWALLFVIPITIYIFTYFTQAYDFRNNVRTGNGNRVTLNAQSLKPVIEGYPYTIFMMTRLYLFPKDLTVYYDGNRITKVFYASMFMVFTMYLISLFYVWKRNRKIAGVLVLLPVLVAPVFSPVKVTWFISERYMYAGTAFFGLLVSYLLLYIEKKTNRKNIAFVILTLLLIAYSVRTYIRNKDWKNTETLSFANMKTSPLSVRPYNDVAGYYYYKGEINKSIEYYEKALTVVPNSGTAISNLGYLYLQFGPPIFWKDFPLPKVNKIEADKYNELVDKSFKTKQDPRTIAYFMNKSLIYNPEQEDMLVRTGDFYEQLGIKNFAVDLYNAALRVNPNNDAVARKLVVLEN